MQPLYTAENTSAAYQLNWSLSLFGSAALPSTNIWLPQLTSAAEKDGICILEANLQRDNVAQFFISSRPDSTPSEIVRSVKGRLQHLIRDQLPNAFRRNYHIQSVGDAKSSTLDEYVAKQTDKHPMADERVQSLIASLQFRDDVVDLARPQVGTYGQYLNSLHVVFEYADGWHEVRERELQRVRAIIVAAAQKKLWRLSRIGLLSNHFHVLLGAAVTESPQSVLLSLMNNIAFDYQMKPVLKFSYYAGTFGGYDRGAIWGRL